MMLRGGGLTDQESITFQGTVAKVQTLADGGIRVSFDLPEDATLAAAHLMACQAHSALLAATLIPIPRHAHADEQSTGNDPLESFNERSMQVADQLRDQYPDDNSLENE